MRSREKIFVLGKIGPVEFFLLGFLLGLLLVLLLVLFLFLFLLFFLFCQGNGRMGRGSKRGSRG